RPRRRGILEVALGQLPRLRPVHRDDEDVLAPIARPADVVELVVQPREPPRAPLLLVLLFVRLVADARAEGDAGAVGRPRELARILLRIGELARLAALGGDDVQLAGLPLTAAGRECELRAVGRPAGRRVALLPRRELPWRARSVRRGEPDRAPVLVLVLLDPPDDDGDCP